MGRLSPCQADPDGGGQGDELTRGRRRALPSECRIPDSSSRPVFIVMTESSPPEAQRPPRILLVSLLPGMGSMHLPRHLARAGLEVVFAGARSSLASRSGHVKAFCPWEFNDGGLAVDPFLNAVRQWRPQWVIPLDELSSQVLQQIGIGRLDGAVTALPADVVELVRRSLGDPAMYSLFAVRRRAFEAARAANIPVPAQADVATLEACLAFAGEHGYPVVLKQESSRGGVGTFILNNEAALREFTASAQFKPSGPPWVVQGFVPGALGMHAVFADRGRVLAQLSAVQISRRSNRLTAPSSVVRVMQHDAMAASCAAFVAATGASGFHGWDFQLDEAGKAWMIEHNPRPISISHLGHLLGSDMCRALAGVCGVAGGDQVQSAATTERLVALFPDEWQRDAYSPLLHEAFHDAPWDDQALLTALLQENMRLI